jgi:hypothetical protein
MTMHPPLQITINKGPSSPSLSSFKKPVSPKEERRNPRETPDVTRLEGSKVSFSKRVKIKKIRSHKHYPEGEREAVWHTPDEFTAIKKRCVDTLRFMQNPEFKECDEWSRRGLEVRTKAASRARKETRALAWQAVLDEQEHQDKLGGIFPDRIREVYHDISAVAQRNAHFMALKDHEVAAGLSRRGLPQQSKAW